MADSRAHPSARLHVLGLTALLFVMACATPALMVASDKREVSWSGARLLALGWGGLFQAQFAWLANVAGALAAVLLYRRRYRPASIAAAAALALSANTFTLHFYPISDDDAGTLYLVQRFGPGLFLWMASFLVMLLGALLLHRWEGSSISPERSVQTTTTARWYHSLPILFASALLFPPAGVVLAWTNPTLSRTAKLGVTVAITVMVLAATWNLG